MLPDRSGGANVVRAMREGGYYDRLMAAGPELDRVKAYVQAMAARRGWAPAHPQQYPDYPMFPGLSHRPFRALDDIPGAVQLQEQYETIAAEWAALDASAYLRYAPAAMDKRWQVHLLHHMGVDLRPWRNLCPRTHEIIAALPGVCLDYPWSDALFSTHEAGSHLRAHCSVDNLRVRCHLALRVPEGCSMRVAGETRTWQEGRVLLFEDSFEHEVWNRSEQARTIFILDFWHPGLTAIEVAALSAGFRKSTVRRTFMDKRLRSIPSAEPGFREFLERAITQQDGDAALRPYWDT